MKKEIKEYITEFLKLMQERIPMSPAKHNLTIGNKGELVTSFIVGEMWYSWSFDEGLNLTPYELVELIFNEAKAEGIIK